MQPHGYNQALFVSITNSIMFSIFGHCISVLPFTDTTSAGMYAHLRGVCVYTLPAHTYVCVCHMFLDYSVV